MLRFILLQREENNYKLIESSNDYEYLYRMMNDEKLREEKKELTIVEPRAWYFPAKQYDITH